MRTLRLSKQILFVAFAIFSAARAAQAEPGAACQIGANANQAQDAELLQCYRDEFRAKAHDNDERALQLATRAKAALREAAVQSNSKLTRDYINLVHKVSQSVSLARKEALPTCFRLASKIKSDATSTIAVFNCRTDREVKLGHALRGHELRLEALLAGIEE